MISNTWVAGCRYRYAYWGWWKKTELFEISKKKPALWPIEAQQQHVFSASRFGRLAYNLPIDSRCTATGYWFQRIWPISILTSTSPWIKQLETSWNIYKYYAHIMFASSFKQPRLGHDICLASNMHQALRNGVAEVGSLEPSRGTSYETKKDRGEKKVTKQFRKVRQFNFKSSWDEKMSYSIFIQ